jgi:hypothetical protein
MTTWTSKTNRKVDLNSTKELEASLGEAVNIVSSQQRAVEIILEALDSTRYVTIVVLPISSPEWLLHAVLRSKATPAFVDDRADMHAAVHEIGSCVVVLYSEFGEPIPQDDLDLTRECVTIEISPDLPPQGKIKTTFGVYDLAPAMTTGAALVTSFEDQHTLVKTALWRSGDVVSPYESAMALTLLKSRDQRAKEITDIAKRYDHCCERSALVSALNSKDVVRYFPVLVNNAAYVQSYLLGNGINSFLTKNSLSLLPYVQPFLNRTFPISELCSNKYLLLPTSIHTDVVPFVVDLVKSVEELESK